MTLRGTISAATLQEIFVHSFAVQSSRSASTVADSTATLWTNLLNTGTAGFPLKNLFSPMTVYQEVTVAEIINMEPPDPRLAAAVHVAFGPIQGGGSGGAMPSQLAIAVSIKAGTRPNGIPQKGRFYLPPPDRTFVDSSSGLLASNVPSDATNSIATWWSQMRSAGDVPSLWSRRYGTIKAWDAIRMGRTVDTQRRRRNELPETYSSYVTVP